MVTAYTTALPPSALPVVESVLVTVGSSLLFAVLLAGLAVSVAVVVQGALAAAPRQRPPLRMVEREPARGPSRHAA
jgi:hypothetical protein